MSLPAYALTWQGKHRPGPTSALRFARTDSWPALAGSAASEAASGRLYQADNRDVMAALLPELAGKIDLAYLDPPFLAGHPFVARLPVGEDRAVGSGRGAPVDVTAYDDPSDPAAYLQSLYERMLLLRELLAPTGSVIVHVNWRAGHLVQAVLDEVFGAGERAGAGKAGFRNEIVWGYGGGGNAADAYRRKHDNLFWYTRSDRWTFHPQRRPYTEGTRQRGLTRVKGPRYALHDEGAQLETWWTGPEVQKILSPTARENWKFPTQKPESLLRRLLLGHSNPGDLVADFYAGSGTTAVAAARLGRRWLLAERSPLGVHVALRRLAQLQAEQAAAGEPVFAFDRYRRADEGSPQAGELEVERVRLRGGGEMVRLVDFRPSLANLPGPLPPELAARARERGPDFLDAWSVDWDYPAGEPEPVFTHRWRAARAPDSRTLPREAPLPPGSGSIAVKGVDLWGREVGVHLPA